MEAWRRQLDDRERVRSRKRACAHRDAEDVRPALAVLEGRRLAGAKRRAKRLLFPTEDGEHVLLVHLMTAGRLKYLLFGEKGPKTPAFSSRSKAERASC